MFGLRRNVYCRRYAVKKVSYFSVRNITIQQPSSVVTTQPISLEDTPAKDDTSASISPLYDADKANGIEVPTFTTIGTPASSLSVTIPPSIPVHVKKGSVISVYSFAPKKAESDEGDTNFVRSKWEFSQPLRSLWLAGKASSYQRVIGTVPLQVLVSAYDGYEGSKSNGVRSFVNLTLDGSVDWAVFKPDSLQCYSGNSLNVKVKSLPRDLHYGLSGRGYTWLSGRGLVSIVGNGSVFKVGLGAGDEIRVGRDNILAMSVNDLADLHNGDITSENWNTTDGLFHKKSDDGKLEAVDSPQPSLLTKNKAVDHVLTTMLEYLRYAVQFMWRSTSQLKNYALGNGHYVVVKGPRSVLVETSSGRDNFVVRANDLVLGNRSGESSIQQLEEAVREEAEWSKPKSKVGDNLGVVRIVDGKATYKNLDNFNDEVKRIENLKNNS